MHRFSLETVQLIKEIVSALSPACLDSDLKWSPEDNSCRYGDDVHTMSSLRKKA